MAFDLDLTSPPVLVLIVLAVVLAGALVLRKPAAKQPVAVPARPASVSVKPTKSTSAAEPAVQASGAQSRPELESRDSRGSGRGFQRTKKLD
ncbi:hypothetical protein CspeluHIS016_0102930 [Cutaneotrichosporon spelunceum]|uniref:Uncharacterized protein n=1 Tax=Cutaneotrichosporon spelunceum TaxID=1672016 RepID=A0AAD3Y9E0_9TREE|nr:hypothetical protein CspeluHIS016_0102930 [Cutaneotrichosporon spelunceum]